MPALELAKINSKYKPSDKEQDIRKWVYKRYREMKESPERQNIETIWTKSEKAWEAFRTPKEDWQSNYFIPLTTSVVESILGEMIEQNPRPLILPRGYEDANKAMIMSHIFDYTWDVANGDEELRKVIKSALIYGTGFAQEFYLRDRRMIRDIIKIGDKSKKKQGRDIISEEREAFEYDDCMMEYVSPWDIFKDDKARDFNRGTYKARDVIRRYVMNYRDAKLFFSGPVWNHLGNFKYVRPGGDTDFYQFYKPPQGIDKAEEVEVLWYWSRKPEDSLVIVINDVVVRMGPNIFKHKQLPFGRCVDVDRLDRFYGKGEPELLDSIQDELNTLRGMVIDRNHLDIDKSFLVSQNTMLNDEDLIARPHAMIAVDDPKSVQSLEYGDIPLSVERTLKAINEDSVRVTGVDDRFQSLQKTPSTATEAAILKESTLKRIKMKVNNLEKGFLVDIGRMRVANILQFYSQPKLEKIVGEKKTETFKQEVAKLAASNMLEVRDGTPYKKKYKEIRLEDAEIFPDESGNFKERKINGFSFFELKPEYYMPVAQGGFDIKFDAGANMPLSKPLMQSKMTELFDRLMPIAITGQTGYDPEKIMDMVVRANDNNPQELKTDQDNQETSIEMNRVEMMIDLAGQEDQMVTQGKQIPEIGTPYALPVHTEVHINFLKSDAGKALPDEQYQILVTHTMGEIAAIEARGGGQQSPQQINPQQNGGQSSPFPASSGMGKPTGPPNTIQGGAQVPTGQALGNG